MNSTVRIGPIALNTRLFTSIQTRLLGVFFINTLLTIAIVMAFNQWIRVQLITEADSALLVSAVQIAGRIDEFNRSNKQVFNTGARLPGLIDFLRASEEERQNPDLRDRTRVTLDSLEIEPWDEYYVLSQAIIDRDGINIIDTEIANIGSDESDQDYFKAALSGGSIIISPVQYRPERSGIYFFYAVPLRDSDPPHSVLGVLRIQVAVASIQNIVFDSVRGQDLNVALFDENYVRVVDTQHEDLLFRSITNYSAEQIANLRSRYALPPLPDSAVSISLPKLANLLEETHQNRVVSGYAAPNDEKERLAIVRLETMPWILVGSQSAQQYHRPAQQQIQGILVLAIALTIIALMSSYFFSRRITRPIRVLTSIAHQVAEGSLHIKVPVTSNDEMGTLAKTFNLMTTELEAAHATLEERVEKRTLQLSEANEKLKHEIFERQRLEQQALDLALEHERRRILSDFIQKASHEFRTPLSIINVKSYLVKRLVPSDQWRHVEVIEDQSKYIEGLVSRMVLMARLDSDMPTPLEDLHIDELIKIICDGMADVFVDKRVAIDQDLDTAKTLVPANPELLSIAVQNILDNALEYSAEGSGILIRTRARSGNVTIQIEDKGVGIPEDRQARVFERFYRVDEAHSTRGFGLGLPIAKRIVENIGGTIDLTSVVGQGTCVTITLEAKPVQVD